MGSFLQAISQVHHQQPSLFHQKIANVSQPIQKIKQYYGLFKSVCDSFLITKEKYTEIFQSNKNLQEVWDRQRINKLDALELFSGLVAFSAQSSFRQKLKFWFVMFDFNQIKNVSFVDLQYLTLCICNATFKVLGKNAKANQSQIVSWLKHDFSQKQRINITKLYAFCIQSTQVKKFFELTTKQPANCIGLKDFIQAQKNLKKLSLPLTQTIPYVKQSKKQVQEKLQWHRQFSKKISTPYNPNTFLHTSKMSWVYGMRIQGLQKPFLLISSPKTTQSQQLLYCTSTLMILYNMKTNKQRYYQGHTRLISSFVYNRYKRVVISASDALCTKSIHIWSYDTLECIKILDTYKPVKSLALLGKNQEMLIVVCGETPVKQSIGLQPTKSTIMIFSLEQKLNYALIYTHTYDHLIKQITNTYTIIDDQQVTFNIWNSFVIVCQHTPTVIFSEFKFKIHITEQGTQAWTSNLKTLAYDFYDEHQSTHKVSNNKLESGKNKNKITCCIALYINEQNPGLRSFITNDESLSLCIITGHENGQVKCVYYSDGQFNSEDLILEEVGSNTPRIARKPIVQSNPNQPTPNQSGFPESSQHQFQDHPVTCLHHTDSHIIFSHSSHITIMPFSFLISKQLPHLRTINILDYPDLRLFNPHIHYFALSQNHLLLVTQNQGDFISIDNRKILFSDMSFVEKQSLKKIKTLTKIQSNAISTMCLLQKVETEHLVYLTTQDRKILIMNSFSKQVENVWEINSPGDHITAIDAVYTDEDVLYFVCGCKEGKLYIRVDNEQNPKFYDCVSEIIDVKISKDASYLLVATAQKYLYFFTQINKNFSSPRKMHFENQIPICMNFLDSNKMFTVNTSAKNVYTIEIPQLKYKNVQKQSEKINISKMKIVHPSSSTYSSGLVKNLGNDSKKTQKSSGYVQQSEKAIVYTKSYLGGELKYFLMTLHNGDLLFFENRYHLANLSYVSLQAHWGQISTITIVEGQQKFYTLGKYDNTLIEWQTQSTRTLTNVPQSVRLYSQKVSLYEQDEFDKMRQMSFYYKLLNYSKPDDLYLFRGTNNQKLNEALKKSLSDLVIEQNKIPNQEESFDSENLITSKKNLPYMSMAKLNMRQPNLSLEMAYVFGIECYKRSSVVFWKQSQESQSILYHSSRFLLALEISGHQKKQHVLEQEKYKISCFIVTEDHKILYALAQPNPKIRIHACDETLNTTHELGIIHFTTYKNYVLSYGILKNTYSINLHNYKTGQLLAKRTTQLKIHQFIFINKSEIISLNQIRIWKDLYPSEKIGKATAGILMPNNSDVCLATDNGSISILNTKKGIFTVVTKAHESDITCITINKLQANEFQLLTVSKDDKIKIWNQKFNCKLMINLRDELLKNIKYLVETEDQRRGFSVGLQNISKDTFAGRQGVPNYRILNIRGIDSRKGKILVYLATGQVYIGKFTLINRKNQLDRSVLEDDQQNRSQPQHSLVSQSNESIFIQMQKNQNRKDGMDYQKQWEKVIESHSCQTNTIFKKFICFTVHPQHPIVVSVGGNDRKLLFRNYETCEMMDTYYCEESRINCLKFSKKGKLLVMGFKNGIIKIFSFQLHKRDNIIKGVDLRFSQKFTVKDTLRCQPINIEFSQNSMYFSVSFISYRNTPQNEPHHHHHEQPFSHQEQESEHKTQSFVQVYKQKHQYSQHSTSLQQSFYSLIDTLTIKQDENSVFTNNKYIRCVYHMAFTYSIRDELVTSKQKEIKPLQDLSDKSMCLVMYEQFVNEHHVRLNHSQRDKFLVYVIEQKTYAKKQFEQVDWIDVAFPELVNVLQLNRFKNQILFLNSQHNSSGQYSNDIIGWNNSSDNEDYAIMEEKFDQNPLSISAMCYYKRDFIIYGGTHGKLHLIRIPSLLTDKSDPLEQIKQQEMSISKTYVSQASFINYLELSSDYKHLFVAGQLDQCIVKYKVEELSTESDLDYQIYDTYQNDLQETYVTKEKFYNFVNSIMPLREQIKNLLQDVQKFDYQKKTNNGNGLKEDPEVGLQVIKVVGRRAYDRCNNIYMNQQNLIYTVGPNLVIQNIIDPFQQKTLPSDPNPLSYSPQISTIHMKPNSNLLILATQQEASRLFVWDIRASICLSELQVNCSVIYNIKLVGDQYAVFYGINSMYQLVIQVVDWKKKRVVALNNFLHSATWKIKDICAIEHGDGPIEQNAIRFITCGVQHLSQWHIRSNTLIETHFIDIPPQSSFQVINYYKDQYIITGCDKGSIYLWKDRALSQQLKVQAGPIRSLEVIVENCTIISGGMDSHVYICKLEQDEIYVQSSKSLNPKLQEINNTSNIESSVKPNTQKQPNLSSPSTFLTQFDIQSIIYSPLIDMTKNYNSLPHFQECNFFAGTRSGDVYFCEYNLKEKEFISVSQIVYGQDHQTIVCTAFSDKEQVLYTLTTSGKLQVWELKVFEKVFSYKFMKKAKKLYVYKGYLLICFEKQVIFIELDIKDKMIKIDENMTLHFDGVISQCVLSFNQQYLAVGLHKNESNEIMIYELEKKDLIYHSPSLKYEIQFLDFSTDEKYLLYKDKFQEIGMIYLVTLKRINTIFVQMKIQWQTQGLRISPKAQRIYCSYNCQNRITTISKLSPNYILVGDEMGTLRIFPYPPDSHRLGELHTSCYTQHMNKINSIKQHKQLTYVATTAVYDRSLILWRKHGLN